MTRIKAVTATVYLGGGRRFLSKHAAYVGEASRMMKQRCCCEPSETDERGNWGGGYACRYHDIETGTAILKRLVRHLKWNDKRSIAASIQTEEPKP